MQNEYTLQTLFMGSIYETFDLKICELNVAM